MSLLGFNSRNHPLQVLAHGVNDDVDDRETDPPYFWTLEQEYGPFTVDVAAAAHNTKCERYYDRETDGLAQSWAGEYARNLDDYHRCECRCHKDRDPWASRPPNPPRCKAEIVTEVDDGQLREVCILFDGHYGDHAWHPAYLERTAS